MISQKMKITSNKFNKLPQIFPKNNTNKSQIFQFDSKITNKNKSLFSLNKFSFAKNSEFEEQIKKELEKSDRERIKEKRIEEWKKIKLASYTKEEFDKHIEGKDEILLIEISDANKRKLFFAKRFCVFFNIPVSLFITFFIDSILPTYIPGNKRHAAMYYGLMITDYILFVNGVLILSAISNVCLNAKYLPKENIVQFVKFNLLNRTFTVKEKIEDVKKISSGPFSPFNSLKSKATNNTYALKGINTWSDIKLFNYLFPTPQKKIRNKEEAIDKRKETKSERAKRDLLK